MQFQCFLQLKKFQMERFTDPDISLYKSLPKSNPGSTLYAFSAAR